MNIAHIVNPFRAASGSGHARVQPITFETMRRARAQAPPGQVELYAATLADELDLVPEGFTAVPPLTRSMRDLHPTVTDAELPLLGDILWRLAGASSAELFVYTNVDIALMPGFYRFVADTYAAGTDAFIINRRTIPGHYRHIEELPRMMAEAGLPHPGYDCFCFPRAMLAHFDLGEVCLGHSGVGRALLINMLAHARRFRLYRDLHLTFHIGDECRWDVPNHPGRLHNFEQNRALMTRLSAAGRLPRHPLVQRAAAQMRRRFAEAGAPDLVLAGPAAPNRPALSGEPAGQGAAALFVCQAGRLEVMSLLLAYSLRRFMPGLELIACVPAPAADWGEVDADTRDALRGLGVEVREIAPSFGTGYPIGNKLACLSQTTVAPRRILLDSDILCVGSFADLLNLDAPFAAKPADVATFSDHDAWRRIYRSAGLWPPERGVRTTVTEQEIPLYFNSGVVITDDGDTLTEAWIRYARHINDMPEIAARDPHLDQIALPVAVQALGLDFALLDDAMNFPAEHKPVSTEARLVHYHRPSVMVREPRLRALALEAIAALPPLAAKMSGLEDWAPLLAGTRVARREGTRRGTARRSPLIISGIPRSGTSFLCAALHAYRDCVVINEPKEVFEILGRQALPWGIPVLYRELRYRIGNGLAVSNKIRGGRLIEDTSTDSARADYCPEVTGEDFLLGTKNTLFYLSRMDALRRVMPDARVVLCVRNPWDTIASWKTSFAHLRDATLPDNPQIGKEAPLLELGQRASLHWVAAFTATAWRRAALWAYLASLVRKHAEDALVLDYARLTTDPRHWSETILGACFDGQPGLSGDLPLVKVGDKRAVLTPEDHQAIDALCMEHAEALGVADNRRPAPAGRFGWWRR